jgi:hypothetical protein
MLPQVKFSLVVMREDNDIYCYDFVLEAKNTWKARLLPLVCCALFKQQMDIGRDWWVGRLFSKVVPEFWSLSSKTICRVSLLSRNSRGQIVTMVVLIMRTDT